MWNSHCGDEVRAMKYDIGTKVKTILSSFVVDRNDNDHLLPENCEETVVEVRTNDNDPNDHVYVVAFTKGFSGRVLLLSREIKAHE